MRLRVGLLLLVLGLPGGAVAEEQKRPDLLPGWERLGDDLNRLATSEGWDWQGWAGLAAAGVLLYRHDGGLDRWVQKRRGRWQDETARWGDEFGRRDMLLPALGIAYLGGWAADAPGVMEDALVCGEAYLVSGLVTGTLKGMAGRARPWDGQGPRAWHGYAAGTPYASFPSAHATQAWAVASALAARHPDSWMGPAAYLLASATSYARLHDRAHWGSDVLVGSAIGFWAGSRLGRSDPSAQVGWQWRWTPLPDGAEVVATRKW